MRAHDGDDKPAVTVGEIQAVEAPASYDDLVARGGAALDAQEASKARQAFMSALTLDDARFEAHRGLSRLAYRDRDWARALHHAERVLAVRPDDREAMLFRARAGSGMSDWSAAARDWRLVSEDRPDWPEARFQHARASLRLGETTAARSIVEGLLAMEDPTAEARAYAVRLLVELNVFAEAKTVFESLFHHDQALAARELDLFDRQNHRRGLAVALRARQDVLGGAYDYDERPLMVSEALFRGAMGHERADDLLEAFLDYDALLVLSPDDGLAQRSRARVARALQVRAHDDLAADALADAAQAFARAVRAAPTDVGLRRNQGRVLMRLREYAAAAPVWTELLRRVPADPEAALQLARALDRSGQFVEAMAAWRVVREVAPDNPEAAGNLTTMVRRMTFAGRAAIAEERYAAANDLFKAVLAEDPANEEAPRRLEQVGRNLLKSMRAAHKAGDRRAVLDLARAAAERLPEDAEVRLLIGRAAGGLRRHAEALGAWTSLARLDPAQSVLAQLQIARCHEALGAPGAAVAALGEVLAVDPENAAAREFLERLRSAG